MAFAGVVLRTCNKSEMSMPFSSPAQDIWWMARHPVPGRHRRMDVAEWQDLSDHARRGGSVRQLHPGPVRSARPGSASQAEPGGARRADSGQEPAAAAGERGLPVHPIGPA